ncbi:MAG: Ig-like domain-containing domain, partial [Planctomycetota bacterium]
MLLSGQPVTVYPHTEGFEAGDLVAMGPEWTFETSGVGEISVTPNWVPRGLYQLQLSQAGGLSGQASAALHLDLLAGASPLSGVVVSFWQRAFGDADAQSGRVEMRSDDASAWTTILELAEYAEHAFYAVDLDAEASAAGLAYTDDFQIRFLREGDAGGSGYCFDDVRVSAEGEDLFGPKVVSHSPDGEDRAPVSSISVTFDEPVSSLPLDQVTLTQPLWETPAPISATTADGLTWSIEFPPQTLVGSYFLRIGPDVRDASPAANPMNQDGNAISGEDSDMYRGTFTV